MENSPSLQLYSNLAFELSVLVDGKECAVVDSTEARSNAPAIFFLGSMSRPTSEFDSGLQRWTAGLEKFLEDYQDYEGPAVMLNVSDLSCGGKISYEDLNAFLDMEDSISTISVQQKDADALWSNMYKSQIQSRTSVQSIYEDALAMCLPIEDEVALESVKSDQAFSNLYTLTNLRATQEVELSTLEKEKEMLQLQLLHVQEELGAKEQVGHGEAAKEKADNQQKIGVLEQEKQLLLIQLEQAQEDLESYYIQVNSKPESVDGRVSVAQKIKLLESTTSQKIAQHSNLLFDANFYEAQTGVKYAHFMHYKYLGWKQGYHPHPLFDTSYYLEQIESDLEAIGMPPLVHYLKVGILTSASICREFNDDFYRKNNPDVVAVGGVPIIHFLSFGWREARKPTAEFDCDWYLNQYSDVADSGKNPFIHYLLHGKIEGRRQNSSEV